MKYLKLFVILSLLAFSVAAEELSILPAEESDVSTVEETIVIQPIDGT